ncbi:hypothetical protein EJ05DRAFT_506434 [Pseudovirgaria hyperparasitica]|uniref:Reverse transcriptase domain-containing protein n=1 Tax=Pseudovirgaria hyperparasitica TaxID=470096 RepID=A0A6A6WKP5_9PEZI|nr:uncharacterized protein EJ05DRAFT_506434 [Pseudovirgaria hyperparasitica]KAF2762748.1 hypothetical protein EJ05DRAFT_506434 [Pseudovirgaria hyperparasitica]
MENVLSPVIGESVTVHIDDILVHATTMRKCAALESKVRQILRDHQILVNDEKSTPTSLEVDYCGFHYRHGTCTPIGKTEAIASWPTPTNQTSLRTFLGQTLMFRDNIPRLHAKQVTTFEFQSGQLGILCEYETQVPLQAHREQQRTVCLRGPSLDPPADGAGYGRLANMTLG